MAFRILHAAVSSVFLRGMFAARRRLRSGGMSVVIGHALSLSATMGMP